MKISSIKPFHTALLLSSLFATSAIANDSSYCGNGKGNLAIGECLTVPNGVLEVMVKLEANDKPEILNNIHVVSEYKGQFFQYRSDKDPEGAIDEDGNKTPWIPITIRTNDFATPDGYFLSPSVSNHCTRKGDLCG